MVCIIALHDHTSPVFHSIGIAYVVRLQQGGRVF